MKLLVLAHTPPPLHGQSLMVGTLVEGLPAHGIALHHVNFLLSHAAADIGRWRPAKVWHTFAGAVRAVRARFRHGCDTLYYIPAPAKRGALYRDWLVMLICRPFFPRLVLHWHAAGLTAWLDGKATRLERTITRALLGRADLSIVLSDSLHSDAAKLRARRVIVVRNGIADPGPPPKPPRRTQATAEPCRVLFLGLCSEEKGLFAATAAIVEANRRSAEASLDSSPAFTLTAAGPFENESTATRFRALAAQHPAALRHVGVVGGAEKENLFAECHLVCLPTRYPAEASPLVLLEALAHDRPILATRWRGIPEIVSADIGRIVSPGDDGALAEALLALRATPPDAGRARSRYLARYTVERHLHALAAALRTLEIVPPLARADSSEK